MSSPHDTRFSLPAIDDDPATEQGVILLGQDAGRLLAGLGLASLADDPALVTLAVDRIRHGSLDHLKPPGLVELGVTRWLSVRGSLPGPEVADGGALRKVWERAMRIVSRSVDHTGPASLSYLAACWLRRDDVDKLVSGREPRDVLPEVAPG
ncbi:DUF6187 family protein [Amycolatopsis sp. H20-H5]|uniref:DUF6187 family protein n=1 Tax=Amycolatopsis sp. H20-H5 TaxID=3046309 RepID=UPI002DBBC1C7|nr:DUF6187 family protein [Amycolatopsis sp. H20-H5]MEC3976943.1 DUF6187 family protein [Amycolatopsis sp. H20-H5]